MASSPTDKASFRVEGSVSGEVSVPSNVSCEGSAPRKASVVLEGSVPGAGSFFNGSVPGKASVAVERSFPGKASFSLVSSGPRGEASVTLKGAVHDKEFVGIECAFSSKASVRVKDPGSGFGTGSFSCEGSLPAPLDGCVLVQGKDSDKGPGPSCTGKDDSKVSVPIDQGVIPSLEYPWILERFRFRRLLSFLASGGFYAAYVAMQNEVSVVLDLNYLQRYLELCQWDDARNYILGVLPYDFMGDDGWTLMMFLTYLRFMHDIATGHQLAPDYIAMCEGSCRDPEVLRDDNLAKVIHTILSMRSQQVSPSVNWNVVGIKAAEIVRDFITRSPEFSDYLRLPRRSSNIHNVVNVLPCGFRSHRTSSVKKAGRVPASVIAKYFLSKGRLQPGGQRMGCSELVTDPDPSAWLKAAIDEALETGMRVTLYQCAYNKGMDRKRSWSSVSQDLDAGSYPKRPQKAETWIPSGDKQAA